MGYYENSAELGLSKSDFTIFQEVGLPEIMLSNRTIIIGIGAIVVLVLVFVVSMIFFRGGTEEGRDLGTLPKSGERPPSQIPPSGISDRKQLPIEALTPLPGVIPLTTPPVAIVGEKGVPLQEIGDIKPPSGIISGPEAIQKIQDVYARIKNSIGGNIPAGQGKLTEKQIFDILWRPDYIAELRKLESIEIRNGEMPGLPEYDFPPADLTVSESEPKPIEWYTPSSERSALQTDQDVFKSLKNLLKIFYQNGWIKDQEYPAYLKAFNEILPKLIEEQRRYLRSGLPLTRILPGQQQFVIDGNPIVLSPNILSGIAFVMRTVEPANALWTRGEECWKDDEPLRDIPIGPPALPVLFCNSAIEFNVVKFKKKGKVKWVCTPDFTFDCGQLGLECWIGTCWPPIELGCLNSPVHCKAFPNALWDPPWDFPEPTTLCGCG